MENMQFETDSNKFNCVECGRKIKVNTKTLEDDESRVIDCKECGTEYEVGKDPLSDGLIVTVKTSSMSDIEVQQEKELEDK